MTTPSSSPSSSGAGAREVILARVRRALGHDPAQTHGAGPAAATGGGRLPRVEIPREYAAAGSSSLTGGALVDLFVERVEDYRATITRTDPAGLPEAIAEALGESGRVVVPDGLDEAWLSGLDPARVARDTGLSATELDQISAVLTTATVGIAVTGTIVLDHGPGQGRRALTLVPDLHVCVIGQTQLVPDVPDAIATLAPTAAHGRPQTWISGPSATSDIELERVEGVHGPRTLRVIVLADD